MTCWRSKKNWLRHHVSLWTLVLCAFACDRSVAQDSRFDDPKIESLPTIGGSSFGGEGDQTEGLEPIEGEAIPGSSGLSKPNLGTFGPVGGYQTRQSPLTDSDSEPPQEEIISQTPSIPNRYRSETIPENWMGVPSGSESMPSRVQSSVLQSQPDRIVPSRVDSPKSRIEGMKSVERANRRFDSGTHEIVRERYSDGSIKIVRTIAQDKEGNYYNDGGWLMYDRQQRPIASGTFVRGAMEGDWERVHEPGSGELFLQAPFNLFNGPYLSKASFVRNEIDGVWTISDRDGKPICAITYEKGVRKGVATWFYPSGKKMREAMFKDGVPHGFVLQWDQQGKVQSRDQFVDGRRVIRKKTTYANQQLASERVFRDRKLSPQGVDNWWTAKPATFSRDGEEVQYGPVAEWYPNRQPRMTGRYIDGLRDGLFTWWHETHNKKAEGKFSRGMRVGEWRYWHESGMKRSEGRFENDKPVGIWRSWNPDGKVVDEKEFSKNEESVEMPSDVDSPSIFDEDNNDLDAKTDASGSAGEDSGYSSEEPVYNSDPFGEKNDRNPSQDPGSLSNLIGG